MDDEIIVNKIGDEMIVTEREYLKIQRRQQVFAGRTIIVIPNWVVQCIKNGLIK